MGVLGRAPEDTEKGMKMNVFPVRNAWFYNIKLKSIPSSLAQHRDYKV